MTLNGKSRAFARATSEDRDLDQSPASIAEKLRRRAWVDDRAFDRFLPEKLRLLSSQYWTPLVVALRAAQWFQELHIGTVVDVGSGPGKFCVAAALAGQCRFVGLEHRPSLVAAARELAQLFDLESRVSFREEEFDPRSTPVADAYYLYNPFDENIVGGDALLDDVELTRERHARDLAAVDELLWRARVGTYLFAYNGFGAKPPLAYREVRLDRELPNVLRAWQKRSPI
jgi:SAM-dependent methyltransferase